MRKDLAHILGIKYKYQQQLTRLVMRLNTIKSLDLLKTLNLNIAQILVRVQFFVDKNYANQFIKSEGVFLNGVHTTFSMQQMYIGDHLQLPVCSAYFVYFRLTYQRTYLFNNKILQYAAKTNWQMIKATNKKTKIRLPDWLLNARFFMHDIPNCFEVDFISLSVFMLFEPAEIYQYDDLLLNNVFMFPLKLYNWKYIV